MTENTIVIRLADQQDALWKQFATNTTEMIVTKRGRNLFPKLEYVIDGLDADKRYAICLEIRKIDDNRYKFSNGKWETIEDIDETDKNKTTKQIWHSDGVRKGGEWMKSNLNFDQVKITNNSKTKEPNNIFLRTMHKYIPFLSIYESSSEFLWPQNMSKPIAVIRIDHTEFIAVTSYQNQEVTSLKIANNPCATRYRENNSKNKRRHSLSTPEDTSPSPKQKMTKFENDSKENEEVVSTFPTSDTFIPQLTPNPFMFSMYSQFLLAASSPYFYFGTLPVVNFTPDLSFSPASTSDSTP